MALQPYIANVENWKHYFVNSAKARSSNAVLYKQSRNRSTPRYYIPLQRGGEKPALKFISPSSMIVDQAKSNLMRLKASVVRKPTKDRKSKSRRSIKQKGYRVNKKAGTIKTVKKGRSVKKGSRKDILGL